ncbi:hypothetical protein PP753_gp19 [Dinoroseobacter phage vB_DshP-R7L]|uniref:Uncharacterized protein n=1 Tax=Dinoroseobacter phage vB_DshP-R7L TaxID=2873349 RepID=A0AAE9BME0_9CAUD|nr:hypothetical protein PP753_gp19 [Dinoroseobacter phage vB_DshP-R7L]UAT28858.1 hypothetical protein R7L_gp19 [Dinoroseobacter phage vB_DshP-R7L]
MSEVFQLFGFGISQLAELAIPIQITLSRDSLCKVSVLTNFQAQVMPVLFCCGWGRLIITHEMRYLISAANISR